MPVAHGTVVVVADDGTSPVGTDEWNSSHAEKYKPTEDIALVADSTSITNTDSFILDSGRLVTVPAGALFWLDAPRPASSSMSLFNVSDFHAAGNALTITDAAITTGTAALTSASGLFTTGDVGKYIAVEAAGAAGVVLVTTISAYVSRTAVTLANNAGSTVSAKTAVWGTDDTAAVQSAIDAAAAWNGTVFAPDGDYLIGQVNVGAACIIRGAGTYATTFMSKANVSGALFNVRYDTSGSQELRWVDMRDFGINGLKPIAPSNLGINYKRSTLCNAERLYIHDCGLDGVSYAAADNGIDHSYYNSLRRCNITRNGQDGVNSPGGELNFIYDNTIDWNGRRGVHAATLYRVYGNLIGDNAVGIWSDSVKPYLGFNHVERSNTWNVQFAGGCMDAIVTGNHFSSASLAGSGSYSDILYEGRYHQFQTNYFESTNAKYCIEEWGTGGITGDAIITGNVFKSFVTGAVFAPGSISGAGPNRIMGNLPLNTNRPQVTRTVITATGASTYTVPTTSRIKTILIRGIGAGGGGGAADGAASAIAAGGGGGSGSYGELIIDNPAASYSVSVGAGGTAGAVPSGTGGTGGNTTFNTTSLVCNGGVGGAGMVTGTSLLIADRGAGGAVGSGGSVNIAGAPGEVGTRLSGTIGSAGNGGSGALGGGGAGAAITAGAGANGGNYGGGGSGGFATANTDRAGGVGGNGVLIIDEYPE
jgi:hypothetical protein